MLRLIVFVAVSIGVYWMLKFNFGKRTGTYTDRPNVYYWCFSVILIIGLFFGVRNFGSKIPGSFFERSTYQGKFYVYLYPDTQRTKSYRVPALIRAGSETSGTEDDSSSRRVYYIETVFMPNGGVIDFRESYERRVWLETVDDVVDNHRRVWGAQLTKERVEDGQ